MALRKGEVIMEDEPSLMATMSLDMAKLMLGGMACGQMTASGCSS